MQQDYCYSNKYLKPHAKCHLLEMTSTPFANAVTTGPQLLCFCFYLFLSTITATIYDLMKYHADPLYVPLIIFTAAS